MHRSVFAQAVPASHCIEVKRVPYRVTSVLRVVWMTAAGIAESRGVQFEVADETDGLLAVGDPVRLRRALLHLVTTAMQGVAQQRVSLRATCTERDRRCAVLRFCVHTVACESRAGGDVERPQALPQMAPVHNPQDAPPYVFASPQSPATWMGGHLGIDDGGNAWFEVRVWLFPQDDVA